MTGQKLDQKLYHRHSGYPGGLRTRTLREQLERRPDRGAAQGRQGDASAQPPRAPADQQAQDLRRPRASARGAGPEDVGGQVVAEQAQYLGTGKRKTSVARVILRPGDGKTWFNGRTLEDYFPRMTHRDAGARAAQDGGRRRDVRPPRPRPRRRAVRPGRRRAPRDRPRARRGRSGAARCRSSARAS